MGVGINQGATFDGILLSDYSSVTGTKSKFGETVMRFAKGGVVKHAAVYYGQSNDGTVYVYSKNGWGAKPEVMKLSTMKLVYPGVSLKGIKSQDSGLYNPR